MAMGGGHGWRLNAAESRQMCAAKLRLFAEIAKIVENILFFQAIFFISCTICPPSVQFHPTIVSCVHG